MPEERELAGRIQPMHLEQEMKTSFISYAMSVIIDRALPDVRDGLKPVHRRILYAMYEDNLTHDKPFRKCATAVGDVLGRYHPHGDGSVYDALVRLAQDFSMRYPLIDGHGNFGSVDGDPPAAYRYTEARMARMADEMLRDIDKETVDWDPNFDESRKEPRVLPARFPLMAFIIGWGAEHRKDFKGAYVIALVVGTVVNYVVGVALFCAVAKASVATGITACVLPFIPTAIIKAILASVIGFAIRERVPELKK